MSRSSGNAPTLLGLPREVRDHILGYAVGYEAIVPPSPQDLVAEKLQKNQRTTIPASVTRAWEQPGSVLFPHNRPSITHLPLLLVNHQLKAETEAVAARSSTFSLDVVYLDDVTLWPTWTSLPHPIVPGEVIDELHVQWRLFIAPDAIRMDMNRSRGLFRPSDGGPPAELWIYYHLLIGLLRFGPAGYRDEKPSLDGGIYIRKLIMDFVPSEEKGFVLPRERRRRNPNDQAGDSELPSNKPEPSHELLAQKLSEHLGYLISLGYHTLDYGQELYERIGSIELHAGDVKESKDLYAQLWRKTQHDPFQWGSSTSDVRWRAWLEWRDEVVERRRKLGFPVGDAATS